MGEYLNPDNSDFLRVKNAELFVDKSEMIRYTNLLIGQLKNKICVTRPRGFGKTVDLAMLTAYYSRGCCSTALFQDCKIAQDPTFLEHLNSHYVIRMDVQRIWEDAIRAKKGDLLVQTMQDAIIGELVAEFPGLDPAGKSLAGVIKAIHRQNADVRFVFLLDAWDAVFRDMTVDETIQRDYLSLLSSLFRGREIEQCLDLVYLTGILPPIRSFENVRTQFWLDGFRECSMLHPGPLGAFVGFTESEVSDLCERWNMPMSAFQERYDGYPMGAVGSVSCPASIVSALTTGRVDSYWANPSEDDAIVQELRREDLPGWKDAVDSLMANEAVCIIPSTFRNNIRKICCKDDVLVLLVHYGYLAYQEDGPEKTVRIPNSEIRDALEGGCRVH